MSMFVFACLFVGLAAAGTLQNWLHSRRAQLEPTGRLRLPPRPGVGAATGLLGFQAAFAFLVGFEFLDARSLPADIGVNPGMPFLLGFGVGIAVYAVLTAVYETGVRALGRHDVCADAGFMAMRAIWPRTAEKPHAVIAVCVLNPWVEETLCRGVLVYWLSERLGGVALPILAALVANLSMHAYQGAGTRAFHVLFFAASVGLLFSPFGLVGAIGMHFAGDVFPVVMFRRSMIAWRERRRKERARPAP